MPKRSALITSCTSSICALESSASASSPASMLKARAVAVVNAMSVRS